MDEAVLRSLTILIIHSPALVTLFPTNAFPNILAANAPNNIGRNPPFSSFASFSIVSLIPSNNNHNSSSDLTILIIFPFIYLKLLMLLYLIYKFSFE